MKELDPNLDPETLTLYRKILEQGGFIPIRTLPLWGMEIDGEYITPEMIIAHLAENGIAADIVPVFDKDGNIKPFDVTIFIDPGT